jgi:hypothetical protein
VKRAPLAAATAGALFSIGCGLETEASQSEEARTTHAVVVIERSENADGTSSRAEALAGFLNVPALADAQSVLGLVGLGLALPQAGTCAQGAEGTGTGPLTETALVEFLDAGDVILDVAGARERLAPYAFPTVTDSISGVLYTSRDRTADPLPSASRYTLTAAGLGLRATEDAPRALSGITANGTPLAELRSVATSSPLDLTWDVEGPSDLVYAELVSSNGAQTTVCTFGDELGAGSVPTDGFAAGDSAQLAVHRLRTHDFEVSQSEPMHGQLRFDFAQTAGVVFE